jgi:hypothetical protein
LGPDCNDRDPGSFPGAVELCDSKDNDCNGMVDEGACAVLTNSTCNDAQIIDLMGQTQRVTIHPDTRMGGMGASVRCPDATTHDGRELWYAVRLPANEVLDVFARISTLPGSDTVLYVQSSCGEINSVVCNDDALNVGYSSHVVVRPREGQPAVPRTWYVLLDGYSERANGPVRLEFSRYPAEPTSCASPFLVGRGGGITGFMPSNDNLNAACASGRFPDEVFLLDANHGRIEVTLTADPGAVLLDAPCPEPNGGQCFGNSTLTVDASNPRRFALDGLRAGAAYTLQIVDR